MRRTMLRRIMLAVLAVCALEFVSLTLMAQTPPPSSGTKNAINGINSYPGPEFVKYAADRDTNSRRIDLFIGDWQGSMPRFEHGSLVLRDILAHGDNFAPSEKGAVLHAANFFAYGRLAPGAWTTPSQASRSAGGLLHSRRRGRDHGRRRHREAAQRYRSSDARWTGIRDEVHGTMKRSPCT